MRGATTDPIAPPGHASGHDSGMRTGDRSKVQVHMGDNAIGSAPRRALIVEDELPIRELLHLHLELAGFQIEEMADGRTALRAARESAFDLVILDVMLPGLDGITLCSAIRGDGANRDTPILMVTAIGDGHSMSARRACGCSAVWWR
jgi:CheY-like chemotaxis protein